MQQVCDELSPLETEKVIIPPAFKLSSKYIIHTVGPRWAGDKENEEQLLTSCYRNALELAHEKSYNPSHFPRSLQVFMDSQRKVHTRLRYQLSSHSLKRMN